MRAIATTYNASTRCKIFLYNVAEYIFDACNEISFADNCVDTWVYFQDTADLCVNLTLGISLHELYKDFASLFLPKILWNRESCLAVPGMHLILCMDQAGTFPDDPKYASHLHMTTDMGIVQ